MIKAELRRATQLIYEVADEQSLQPHLPQVCVPDGSTVAMNMDNTSMAADGVFHGI